jgi:hypothetical protein
MCSDELCWPTSGESRTHVRNRRSLRWRGVDRDDAACGAHPVPDVYESHPCLHLRGVEPDSVVGDAEMKLVVCFLSHADSDRPCVRVLGSVLDAG